LKTSEVREWIKFAIVVLPSVSALSVYLARICFPTSVICAVAGAMLFGGSVWWKVSRRRNVRGIIGVGDATLPLLETRQRRVLVLIALSGAVAALAIAYTSDLVLSHETIITISELDPPGGKLALTRTFAEELGGLEYGNPQVRVEVVDPVQDPQTAEARARNCHSDVFFWGSYDETSTTGRLYIHYLDLRRASNNQAIDEKFIAPIQALNTFSLQGTVAADSKYLALLTLGLEQFDKREFRQAELYFVEGENVRTEDRSINVEFAYFMQGNSLYNLAQYSDAIRAYGSALRLNPKLEAAFANRGTAEALLGMTNPALADFAKSLREDPQDVGAMVNEGAAFLLARQPNETIRVERRALILSPGMTGALVNLGYAYQMKNQLNLALDQFAAAAKDPTATAMAAYQESIILHDKGQLKVAIGALDEVINLEPTSSQAYTTRGEFRFESGDNPGALQDEDKAIELDATNDMAYTNRALVDEKNGRAELAFSDFSKALKINPKTSAAYADRGDLYRTQGKPKLAIIDVQHAIALGLYNTTIAVSLTKSYLASRQNKAALTAANDGLRLDSDDRDILKLRAQCEILLRDWQRARDDVRTLANIRQDDDTYTLRGLIDLHTGRSDDAQRDFQKALLINPHEQTAIFNLGFLANLNGDVHSALIYYLSSTVVWSGSTAETVSGLERFEVGDYKGAIAHYRMAIKLDPKNPVPHFDKAFAENLIGREADMRIDLHEADQLFLDGDNLTGHRLVRKFTESKMT